MSNEVRNRPYFTSIDKVKVRAIFEDSKGVFWIGTQGDGLHIMDRASGKFQRLTYDKLHPEKLSRPPIKQGTNADHITFIIEDGAGDIWIGTYLHGLSRYNPNTNVVTRFYVVNTARGFSDSTTWTAYKSRDGTLWISTETSKLFRVDPGSTKFSFTTTPDEPVCFLEYSPGKLWMGLRYDGLAQIDTREKIYNGKIYPVDPSQRKVIGVKSICAADNGLYWAATPRGLYLFDPVSGNFNKCPYTEKATGNYLECYDVLKSEKNKCLYVCGRGFYIIDTRTDSICEFWADHNDSTTISGDTTIVSVEDKAGNLWIGTRNSGLNYFDLTTKKFAHFLPGLTVFAICIDKKETIWAGTVLGLYRKAKNENSFSPFAAQESQLNTVVTGLIEDNVGNIWGSSPAGIFRIDDSRKEFCLYGNYFGTCMINGGIRAAMIQTSTGKIVASAYLGYHSFDPRELINEQKPQVILTGMEVNGQRISVTKDGPLRRPVEEVDELTLSHNQNTFSFDFVAIHYNYPEGNRHQYMLDNYDNKWRDAGTEKTAYYSGVPPGRYLFRIRGTSGYGRRIEKSIRIVILPPWWQSWWAYCAYGLLFIGALWAFIKWRTASLNKDKALLEEKVAARTRELMSVQAQLMAEKEAKLIAYFNQKFSESELKALRAQMNPHFVFNILNTIESYALENNKEAASRMIQKFSQLTRMVLENSMNPLVPFESDLKSLQLYIELEQMRYPGKFLVTYNIQGQIIDGDYHIPPMIIQPFVENAILHGLRNRPNNNGILSLSANAQNGHIIINVEDNGIGRAKCEALKGNSPIQKKSVGIAVTQDRISIFNNINLDKKANVHIEDLSEGTRVVITLPIA